jgi:hypothetical protein
MTDDLKSATSHFWFGENWHDSSGTIDDRANEAAVASLKRLLPSELTANREDRFWLFEKRVYAHGGRRAASE